MNNNFSTNEVVNYNKILRNIKKDKFTIKNRLQSIIYDIFFVSHLKKNDIIVKKFPLIANERSGTWCVFPEIRFDTCYFKSNDGHTNVWDFSLKRLNFHLLPIIGKYNGVSIVDTTRKGKLIPDSLLKTIPIWCAVLNLILFEGDDEVIENELKTLYKNEDDFLQICKVKTNHNWLFTPKEAVSEQETYQIIKKLPFLAENVKRLNLISKNEIINFFNGKKKPIIPLWFYPHQSNGTSENNNIFNYNNNDNMINNLDSQYFVACISASKKENDQFDSVIKISTKIKLNYKYTTWTYIQGASDDHENWLPKDFSGYKFDSLFFWNHIYYNNNELNKKIIDTDTNYIYQSYSDEVLITELKSIKELNSHHEIKDYNTFNLLNACVVKNDVFNTGLIFGSIDSNIMIEDILQKYCLVESIIILSINFGVANIQDTKFKNLNYYSYKIDSSKKSLKELRSILKDLVKNLTFNHNKNLIVLSENGVDGSLCLILILLCKFYDLNWCRLCERSKNYISKDYIKQQFGQILKIKRLNPSRAVFQVVNNFFLSLV